MTIPWASKDDDHVTSHPPPSHLLDFQDLVDDIKLCFITLDSCLVENLHQPASWLKSYAVVNDIFFDIHDSVLSDSGRLNDEKCSSSTESTVKPLKKYTVFIIIVSRYEPLHQRIENINGKPKVKTCGKHRKSMLKSSFLGLTDIGETYILDATEFVCGAIF